MNCLSAREAISARIDGEDPCLPASALDEHLASCADCRYWQQRAHELTRRARLGGPFPERDLTAQVLAAVLPVRPRPRRLARRAGPAQRGGLAVVALAQLAITVPLLILGHDHDAGAHAAHELGSFDLALAIAFAAGAIRPALSAGLAWPCGAAAAGLLVTAVADLIGGQTIGADEAQHLIAVAGAALLCWQAGTLRSGAAESALETSWSWAAPPPGRERAAGQVTVLRPETPSEPRGGGSDAAQATPTDVAARDGGKVA
jgi:predicted anti-sigma-YlaC factor YlaD